MNKPIQSILAGMLALCIAGAMAGCKGHSKPVESTAGASASLSEIAAPSEQISASAATSAQSSDTAGSTANAAAFPFELVTDNDAIVTFNLF